jgi:hypothetical protein
VSEPATLFDLLNQLNPLESFSNQRPTVVLDAGIATEDNLARLRLPGYRYICVTRSRPKVIPADRLVVLRKDEDRRLQVQKQILNGEVRLFCQSAGCQQKVASIRSRMPQRFEAGLEAIAASLKKPNGIKDYDRIMIRLGRLKEKYPAAARFYQIDVEEGDGLARSITWKINNDDALAALFAGA